MTLSHVFFRADATQSIGVGHVMRCLALAQYIAKQGIACHLLTTNPSHIVVQRWLDCGFSVHNLGELDVGSVADSGATLTAINEFGSAAKYNECILIADHYDFQLDYFRALRTAGFKLGIFDDLADRPMSADWVINQNPGAEQQFDYTFMAPTTELLGAQYVVLRDGIKGEKSAGGRGLLITMGGADLKNLGLKALQGLLAKGAGFPIHLVCSAPESGYNEAVEFAQNYDHVQVSSLGNIEKLMVHADLALCAGGVTALELAHLGVGSVIVILADNQRAGALALQDAGASRATEDLNCAVDDAFEIMRDVELRRNMAMSGRTLIDGKGADRIFKSLVKGFAS